MLATLPKYHLPKKITSTLHPISTKLIPLRGVNITSPIGVNYTNISIHMHSALSAEEHLPPTQFMPLMEVGFLWWQESILPLAQSVFTRGAAAVLVQLRRCSAIHIDMALVTYMACSSSNLLYQTNFFREFMVVKFSDLHFWFSQHLFSHVGFTKGLMEVDT